jgi:uncharacterized membrane protein YfcA
LPDEAILLGLAAAASALGALGGIGGAVLLVPALLLLDVPASEAAPLGLIAVAAGSLAAGPQQLRAGLVHHRLGLVTETGAATGAVLGALAAGALPPAVLTRVLALAALAAGLAGIRRGPARNPPRPEFVAESPGEWPGTLAGAYRLGADVIPYQARRLPAGWTAMLGAGVVSGMAGIGGGFIKTPAMRELMSVPVKVAAATSTFTVGITAAAALVVMATQGRVDLTAAPAVLLGALVGGTGGAMVQDRLRPERVRLALGVLLVAVSVVLL